MRTPAEHIKTLQRRVDFLKSRDHKNSYDAAELGSLEWALVNLSPQRQWVGLTDQETNAEAQKEEQAYGFVQGALWAEDKLKEKNGI